MSQRNFRIAFIGLSAVLLALSCMFPARAQERPLNGKPTFKLLDLEGRMNDLGDLHGHVVLISFGATWCAPCTAELHALEEVIKEYDGKPVKFFWVSIESPEQATDSALRRYAKQRKVSFPVLRDSSQAVFLQFTTRVRLPMIVMLAKDGNVDQPVQFGMRSPVEAYKSDIRARLNKLLTVQSDSDQ
jgi:peroxiredoxin